MELSFFSLFLSVFKLFSYLFIGGKGNQSLYPPHFWSMPSDASDIQRKLHCTRKGNQIYIDIGVLLFWFIPRIYIDRQGNPRSLTIASLVTSVLPAPHCIALQRSYPNIDRTEYDYICLTTTLYMYITLCLQSRRDLLLIFRRPLHEWWSISSCSLCSLSISIQRRAWFEDNYFWKDLNRVLNIFFLLTGKSINHW